MSVISELEDFDFLSDPDVEDDIYKFAPMFVHIAGYAYEGSFLDEKFIKKSNFEKYYSQVKTGKISFKTFIQKVLKGRLTVEMFKKSAREFFIDYVELSGYSEYISKYYQLTLWDFPQDPSHFNDIYAIIDKCKINYDKHKKIYPELAIFYDKYEPL